METASAPRREFAVLLNASARRMGEHVVERLREVVPPDNVYVTHSEEEGERVIEQVLSRGYDTIFTGGGDGTVVHLVNRILQQAHDAPGSEARLPTIGILRLGTGNALAQMVSSGDYLCDIKSFIRNAHRDHHLLPLVECEGRHFPFGGLGWDAEILNDYQKVKAQAANSVLKPIFQNVGGYFAAAFAYTIPRNTMRWLRRRRPTVRVVNVGAPAEVVDAEGNTVRTLDPDEVVYEGHVNAIIAGTCPYFGYGLKLLPHAMARSDRMHVRIATIGVLSTLGHLPSLWKGHYRGGGFLDVLAEQVRITADPPMPYEEAGDAMGYRASLEWKVCPVRIRLLRFI